jgi:membrane protein YqaA with SNARE-associated domain
MDLYEIYSLLFTDVLTSNFAFNISSEIVLDTMQTFGNYDKKIILLVAIIAYTFSICINYIFGIMCSKILAPANQKASELNSKIEIITKSRFLPIIIIISFAPFFGKFIILFSGFCRINFIKILTISVIAKLIYYIMVIFYT